MRTPLEKNIIEKRRSRRRGNEILVPLLEELMKRPLEIDDEEDIEFLEHLIRRRARARVKGVYSPSQLGSCKRQIYFLRTGQDRRFSTNVAVSGYFLDGNFRHLKWQFAIWKLHRQGKVFLYQDGGPFPKAQGMEIRVGKRGGDSIGTLDILLGIPEDGVMEWYVVDVKGMNAAAYMLFQRDGTTFRYRLQIVRYAKMATFPGIKINNCLLLGENKNGTDPKGSALGLQEELIRVKDYEKEIAQRLKEIRGYEERNETPQIECEKTSAYEFQGCPFSWFCRGEVEKFQADEKAKSRNTKGRRPKVARSTRGSSSSRSRKRGD